MNSRLLHMLVLVWTCAWFGIILPGHQRGSVTMPDTSSRPTIMAATCCNWFTPARDAQPGDDATPRRKRSGQCALCYQALTTAPPPPPMLPRIASTPHIVIDAATPGEPVAAATFRAARGRAPPRFA